MSATTGPILAVGAITMINQSIFHSQPIDWRVPIATGFAAGAFSLMEKAQPKAAALLAWTVVITVLITRVDPKTPSPTETALDYWNNANKTNL